MTEWEAMALGTAGITSALAVHELESNGVRPGDGPVVVTGATGDSGSLAVSMLAGLGYDVTAVTGNAARTDYLHQLGASRVVPRPELQERPPPLESAEWAGAVDCVGGQTLAWRIRTTRRHGVIATFGNAGGNGLPTSVLPFILRGPTDRHQHRLLRQPAPSRLVATDGRRPPSERSQHRRPHGHLR